MGGMSSGSIGEFKYSAPSHQLANVSIIRTRTAGSMAKVFLKNGVQYDVRTNVKGFKQYVIDRGLIQNRGVYLDMNPAKHFGWDTTLEAPRRNSGVARFFVNYWIAAPRASTDTWLLKGWDGDDFIQGTDAGENDIRGNFGDDYLHGSAYHPDRLDGGHGDDNIYGYKGDDTIFADAGSDVLVGGQGDDTLFADEGNDSLYGAKGDDTLRGGPGDDLLMGGPGKNRLDGAQGADRFGLLQKAENVIHDFDPFGGDQLLIRSKDMAKLKILTQGSRFFLDFGKKGHTTIFPMEGTDITADNIMDAISFRI